MANKKQKTPKYRTYITTVNGRISGSIPYTGADGKKKFLRKIFETHAAADDWVTQERAKLQGNSGVPVIEKKTTFAEAANWYKTFHLVPAVIQNEIKIDGQTNWQQRRAKLDRITEYFGGIAENTLTYDELKDPANCIRHQGGRPLSEISAIDLKMYSRWRLNNSHFKYKKTVSQRSVNDDFALIRSMMKAAKDICDNLKIPKFPIVKEAEVERDRIMTFEEEAAILAQCFDGRQVVDCMRGGKPYRQVINAERAHLRPIVILAVETAMRKGEIFKLDWKNVDLENGLIEVIAGNSKTRRKRLVPITARVRAALESLPSRKGKVFAGVDADRAWDTATEKAGVGDLRFHDLRHTGTTRMIRSGTPHMEVMKITGHRQITTFLRYLNITGPTVQDAGRLLGDYVQSQMDALEVSAAVN